MKKLRNETVLEQDRMSDKRRKIDGPTQNVAVTTSEEERQWREQIVLLQAIGVPLEEVLTCVARERAENQKVKALAALLAAQREQMASCLEALRRPKAKETWKPSARFHRPSA